MAWNWYKIGLVTLLLVAGSATTLFTKWADETTSESSDGLIREFRHPIIQAWGMCLGEMLCFAAFFILKAYRSRKAKRQMDFVGSDPMAGMRTKEGFNPMIFWPAAICHMTGRSLMYLGLTITYASSAQMLRGSVIIFTGVMSVLFLKRKLKWYQWAGMVLVVAGLVVVAVSDMQAEMEAVIAENYTELTPFNFSSCDSGHEERSHQNIVIGDILVIAACFLAACQMIYEEKFIKTYGVHPLLAEGLEGSFGFCTLCVLLVAFYFIPIGESPLNIGFCNPRNVLEDAIDAFHQLGHSGTLAFAFAGSILSISVLNFAGLSITRAMSATHRVVLDSVRTIVIWAVSIGVGWQGFHALTIGGFVFLLLGMFVYNNIVIVPSILAVLYKLGWLERPQDNKAIIDSQAKNSIENGLNTITTEDRAQEEKA